jgi:hypothetical protein
LNDLHAIILLVIDMSFINNKRLRDYPRIFFVTIWIILLLSILLRDGWLSAFNQVIGSDFVTLYAAGMIHKNDLPNLYNFNTQYETQQALIEPTKLPGLNPYISPPYVAAIYSLFNLLPLQYALVLWSIISLALTLAAVYLLIKRFPEIRELQINFWQLSIITLSFFPWVEGFLAGQNHSLAFFLVACIVLFSLADKWILAGTAAGLLIYKPQLTIGLLIIWIIWRKYKAIASFIFFSILCVGIYIIFYGLHPILSYLNISNQLLLLPYIPGFPGYLLLTFYGFFATLFPIKAITAIRVLTTILSLSAGVGLCWLGFRLRDKPIAMRTPAILLAITLPLVATPYVLLHDLVVIIPGLILWYRYRPSNGLLYTVIGIYLGGLFLTLFATVSKVAFVSLLSIGMVGLIYLFIGLNRKEVFASEAA